MADYKPGDVVVHARVGPLGMLTDRRVVEVDRVEGGVAYLSDGNKIQSYSPYLLPPRPLDQLRKVVEVSR